ncbi:hypothetical protein J437_LFUL011740 [Ladona fulva]|uniref:Uncharacterized protein n=1 Tax=Ladona fulva TaxID=123851 RepID=A0A8K0P3B8_LADFU|nr:hypothetical protein J437_LFUL011740 [Ladona fulva]
MSEGSAITAESQNAGGMDITAVHNEEKSEKTDGEQTSNEKQIIETLKDQLRIAKEENLSQKLAMETQRLQFEKEKQEWLNKGKDSLSKTDMSEGLPDEKASKEQMDILQTLESSLLASNEELKIVKDQLLQAKEKLLALEAMQKNAQGKHPENKENKGIEDTNQQQNQNKADQESLQRQNEKLRAALHTAVERLKNKTMEASSVEKQNVQLRAQVASLKEVTSITKDLLGIRSAEVEHLRNEMDSVEAKVKAEREERSAAIAKVATATQLNGELKKEYEIQMRSFKHLKSKYEEKVELLLKENKRLVAEANLEGRPSMTLDMTSVLTDEDESPLH